MDNETNSVVKISVCIGLLIEIWKIHKVINIKVCLKFFFFFFFFFLDDITCLAANFFFFFFFLLLFAQVNCTSQQHISCYRIEKF